VAINPFDLNFLLFFWSTVSHHVFARIKTIPGSKQNFIHAMSMYFSVYFSSELKKEVQTLMFHLQQMTLLQPEPENLERYAPFFEIMSQKCY
jgi:hypothetical protein